MPFPLLNQSGTVAWDDGTVSMVIRMENGKQTLVAKDKEGKELFNGPIDTEEQPQQAPAGSPRPHEERVVTRDDAWRIPSRWGPPRG